MPLQLGYSPTELLVSRKLRTNLPMVQEQRLSKVPIFQKRTPQKVLDKETESVKGEVETVFLGPVGKGVGSWMANITVCGQPLRFKIDTGADVTAISEEDYRKIKGKGKLAKPSNILRGPSNQPLPVAGLGNLGEPYEIKLKRNSKPVSLFAPKRVPIPLRKQVQTELDQTEALGVVSKVANSSCSVISFADYFCHSL
ncbi:hypothetical protein EMCRGX_G004198 [Ephydatia muelleri]